MKKMKNLSLWMHDENGLDYRLVGDYYIPIITMPEEKRYIGRWGRMYQEYLQEAHPILMNQLIMSGKLWSAMADVQEQAESRYELLMGQMSRSEGITEALKRQNPMEWVRRMNNLRNRVEEIIQAEIIYV